MNQAEGITGQRSAIFPPPPSFVANARLNSMTTYRQLYEQSMVAPEGFWSGIADELHWYKKWDRVLNADNPPYYRWFENGKTNLCYNCLDRHLEGPNKNKAALICESESGEQRILTYYNLYREVCRFANVLKALGVKRGDRVTIYLPMIPELVYALLACCRIGAIHSVIFAGFSADSVRDRILDCGARCVITADGSQRRGKALPLKDIIDEAIADCPSVERVLVVKRYPDAKPYPCTMRADRDVWYHDLAPYVPMYCPCEEQDAEDMLFLLYTSGTTGKPKGIIHTTGGYMVYSYVTARYALDLQPADVYFCSADIGWITGHSYIVYGPLQNGATVLIYDGAPNWPDYGRYWYIVEKFGVTIFYTAPTAIRAFMKWGTAWPEMYDLSTLRLLGSVGEPINPEAWLWYHKNIGGERCPIIDTWWQTETGGMMITPLPGATPTKPGSASLPFFGIDAAVLDEEGHETENGLLAIRRPWPGMLRGIYGDPDRYRSTYWNKWGGKYYFPGDGARRDEDGYFWISGRVDDVVNVSGHRIGTAELESAFNEHPAVAESAVIGVTHPLKGQALLAFVSLKEGYTESRELKRELEQLVGRRIGKFASPENILFAPDLPKTRSGKIMRRLLRDVAEGRELGNVTTLTDPAVVDLLRSRFGADDGLATEDVPNKPQPGRTF